MASITATGLGHQIGLGQALADLQASGQHEGVGDAAADDQLIDVGRQALEDGELGATLEPATMATSGRFGVGQGFGDGVDLGGQATGRRRQWGELGDAVGRAFGTVGGAEGVVHKDVAQGGHLLC
jgi:hypothetical protein